MTEQIPLDTDIAVIGIACQFPQAKNWHEFWNNLWIGRECVQVGSIQNGRIDAYAGLESVEDFDAAFFGYSDHEASLLDPQHRKFLECCWHALEDACCDPFTYQGRAGIFGGTGISSYLFNNVIPSLDRRADRTLIDSTDDLQVLIANDKDYFTSRVSYKLNLRGPSVNVQAACSTSLFAIHYAVQGLLIGDCDIALAGAASIPIPQITSYEYEPNMVFSIDGHCRPFDENSSGTIFGSGVGVVVLKRAVDAVRDGDRIYALIKGTAVGNDGSTKVGMTAPSATGQADVIRGALDASGLKPKDISYVEAHGTATAIGDSIEVSALTSVFGKSSNQKCAIGSVKGNIGHAGWAAGMAGFIKTVLALYYKKIPASINFTKPNKNIDFSRSPFTVNAASREWNADTVRRAGVSAFGLGGANAHIILEEVESDIKINATADDGYHLLVTSGRSLRSLNSNVAAIKEMLKTSDFSLGDISSSSLLYRRHFEYRAAAVGCTPAEMAQSLEVAGQTSETKKPKIGFLFPGQGAEYIGMGNNLYKRYPVYRSVIDGAAPVFQALTGQSIYTFLCDDVSAYGGRIGDLSIAQPLLFVVEVALAKLWQSWGVKPDMVLGHSLGEFSAACIAQVFTLQDGLELVAERGRLIQTLEQAGMAVVFVEADTVNHLIKKHGSDISIASINAPENVVVAGSFASVQSFVDFLARNGIEYKTINIDRAGHCALMDPILDRFEAVARKKQYANPCIPLISNVTGMVLKEGEIDARYWRNHLRHTIRYDECIKTAVEMTTECFIEIGPSASATSMASANIANQDDCSFLTSLSPKNNSDQVILSSLAHLYIKGHEIDWSKVVGAMKQKVSLPAYAFDRTRCWIESHAPDSSSRLKALSSFIVEWVKLAVSPDKAKATLDWILLEDVAGAAAEIQALLKTIRRHNRGQMVRADVDTVKKVIGSWPVEKPLEIIFPLIDEHTFQPEPFRLADMEAKSMELIDIIRAIVSENKDISIHFVTGNAFIVGDNSNVCLVQAGMAALIQTITIEYPDVRIRHTDIESLSDLRACFGSISQESVTAYRVGQAYGRRLKKVSCQETSYFPLQRDEHYLIVGGLTGLGLEAAQQLVSMGARHLILCGRRPPDDKATKIVEALQQQGAFIDTISLDVSDYDAVKDLIIKAQQMGSPIKGIISTAAVIRDGTIATIRTEDLNAVLSSKVLGAYNLHCLATELCPDLRFFVVFSSLTSMIGNAGQGAYAAASFMVDQLMLHRKAKGLPGLAINWGPWRDVGHLGHHPEILESLERAGMRAIGLQAGMQAFSRVLGMVQGNIGIFDVDWQAVLTDRPSSKVFFQSLLGSNVVVGSQEETLSQDDPANLRTTICEVIKKVMGRTEIEEKFVVGATLASLGLDSLQAIQIRNRLQKNLSKKLPATLCYENDTLDKLEAFIVEAPSMISVGQDDSRSAHIQSSNERRSLSLQQQRWLSLVRYNYGRLVTAINFNEPIDRAIMLEALRSVVQQHEILRWKFLGDHAVVQSADIVIPENFWESRFYDYSQLAFEERKKKVEEVGQTCWNSMTDPLKDMSWDIKCIKLADNKYVLLLSLQHLEFDGSSISIFVDCLREAYKALFLGRPLSSDPVAQYSDFVAWQSQYMQGDVRDDRNFFEGLYATAVPRTLLPQHTGSKVTHSRDSRCLTLPITDGLGIAIKDTAAALKVSSFALLSSAYAKLIGQICGQDIVTIGTIVNGRPGIKFQRTIGPFVAPFPIPFNVDLSISSLARQSNSIISSINERCAYPPADMVKNVPAFTGFPFDTYYTDPFIMFNNYEKEFDDADFSVKALECLAPQIDPELAGLDAKILPEIAGLFLIIDIVGHDLRFNFWYHEERFAENTVMAWAKQYQYMLEAVLKENHTEVKSQRIING